MEMVHGSLRVAAIYTLGAAGAGLGRSITEQGGGMNARWLTGSSGTPSMAGVQGSPVRLKTS